MPCDHARLAELPAQENHVATDFAGEIDQTLVDILEEATERFDLAGDFAHPCGDRAQFGVEFDNFRQAHRINVLVGANQLPDAFPQCAGLNLQVTNEDFESWDKLVRIGGAEELLEVMTGQFRLMRMAPAAERDYVH